MKNVFISSTSYDLADYREAVDKIIARFDLRPINMDNFGSQVGGAVETSLREVEKADIFVGIIAHRYGYVPEGMEKSVTQQEYDKAVELDMPRLMYLVDLDFGWDAENIETDAQAKLEAFKNTINSNDVRSYFTTPNDLAAKVAIDLIKWIDTLSDETVPESVRQEIIGDDNVSVVGSGNTVSVTTEKSNNWGLYGLITLAIAIIALVFTVLGVLPEEQRNNTLYNVGLIAASETATNTATATVTATNTATATPTSTATNTPTITPTPLEGIPFTDEQVGVILADFTNSSEERMIERNLEIEFRDAEIEFIRVDHSINDRDHARQISELYNATITIWGEEVGNRVEVFYEITPRGTQDIRVAPERVSSAPSDFASNLDFFESYIADGMEVTYVVRFIEGQIAYFQDDYTSARDLFTEAIELIPSGREDEIQAGSLYIYRGIVYYELGDYQTAIDDFSAALGIDPDDAIAYNNRGNAYHELGDYQTAIDDYNAALAIDPDDADAYYNRGIVYYELGDYQTAIADYTAALDIDPDFSLAYYNRGLAYYDLGEYETAIDDYTAALDIDPDHANAYIGRGLAYANLGEYQTAIDDFSAALAIDPDDAIAYNNRGNAYRNLGEFQTAIDDYTAALAIDPDFAIAYYNRGNAYGNLGEFQTAIDDFSAALAIDPDFTNALRGRGVSYYLLGIDYYEAAIADYEQYAELTGALEPYMVAHIAEMQAALDGED